MITLVTNNFALQEIGVKALSGYLASKGIPTRAVYMEQCGGVSDRAVEQFVEIAKGSTLIGFSLMSKDVDELRPLMEAARRSEIPTALGGVHATAFPKECMGLVDFVCVGEGEEPLSLLYAALMAEDRESALSDVANLFYRRNGEIVSNPASFFVESLDDHPYPDYSFKDAWLYSNERKELARVPTDNWGKRIFFRSDSFLFYSQRGCPFRCTYCSNSLYHSLAKGAGKKWYRLASVDRIGRELESHLKLMPFVKHVGINDDDFLARDLDELRRVAGFLGERGLSFTVNAIPGYVTEEKLSVLAERGLTKVSFGVQSGSNRVLKQIYHRAQTNEQVRKAAIVVAKFADRGVLGDYGFILDNPYETDADSLDTLKLLVSLPRPRSISLYSLTFFGGTALAERAKRDGFIQSGFEHQNKAYQTDIDQSFINTLFYLNKVFRVPEGVNRLLLSRLVFSSLVGLPVRLAMRDRDRFVRVGTGIKALLRKIRTAFYMLRLKNLKRVACDIFERTANPDSTFRGPIEKGWSVVVVTGGTSPETLRECLLSADLELRGTPAELIVVGPPGLRLGLETKVPVRLVTYRELHWVPGLITKKKNIGAFAARYDKVAVCHDYIRFDRGWKDGYDKFGEDFEVCMNKVYFKGGRRSRDWVTWDFPGIGPALLPYERECTPYQYISGTYWVVKRDFFMANPLDERRRWGEAEDIEWSLRVREKCRFSMNIFSSVTFLREKPSDDAPYNPTWERNSARLAELIAADAAALAG